MNWAHSPEVERASGDQQLSICFKRLSGQGGRVIGIIPWSRLSFDALPDGCLSGAVFRLALPRGLRRALYSGERVTSWDRSSTGPAASAMQLHAEYLM